MKSMKNMSTLAPTFLTDALADFQRAEQALVRHASSRLDPHTGRLVPGSCPYGCCVDPVRAYLAISSSAWLMRPEDCVLHSACRTATDLLAAMTGAKREYDDARRACGVYVEPMPGLRTVPRISVTLDAADLPTEQACRSVP
jgi:hypothetical protein